MAKRRKSKGRKGLSRAKAGKILHEGMARGKALTPRQRRYMGWVAGGSKPRKRRGRKTKKGRSR